MPRAPAVGQYWPYGKHDYFAGALIDSQMDCVFNKGDTLW
jgi:hypothetical protein